MKRIFLLVLLIPLLTAAQNQAALMDTYMQAHANIKGFSGTVLVMQHNVPVFEKAYGMADREWNIPNTTDTKFRIGSITKQFTAVAILQLVDAGKLSLDDKLSRFFPGYPKGDSVTIHMLLNHTSGIANFTEVPEFDNVSTLSWTKDSMIAFFKDRPYNNSPGTKFHYTNSGYFLLGYIIEKVSGETYEHYIRIHILDKLGMSNSGVDNLNTILPKRARGYSKVMGKYVNAEMISLAWPYSAGTIYSTVEDLYKWDRALYNTSLLSAVSKQKMFSPGKSSYGYGVIIDSLENHYRIWHNGGIPGFVSNISRFPDDDVCIIVLSNDSYNADQLASGLASILFGLPYSVPYVHKEIKLDPSLLDRYVGKYNAFLTIEVIKKNGKLYRHRDGTPDIELKAESETKLYYDDDSDRQLEFELDPAGHVTKIWFINMGQRGEMKKIQ